MSCSQTSSPGIRDSGKHFPLVLRSEEMWACNSVSPRPALAPPWPTALTLATQDSTSQFSDPHGATGCGDPRLGRGPCLLPRSPPRDTRLSSEFREVACLEKCGQSYKKVPGRQGRGPRREASASGSWRNRGHSLGRRGAGGLVHPGRGESCQQCGPGWRAGAEGEEGAWVYSPLQLRSLDV